MSKLSKIMKVIDIPANELVTMTPELYQEFCRGGCVPACHLTTEWISIGDQFHLSTVKQAPYAILSDAAEKPETWETRDVMLSAAVTVEQYNAATIETLNKAAAKMRAERRGCYRVNGKIVIE